ncbi:MAG TPA: phosphatase PAP2 family protein [Gemmatimonadaceae bacterium]|nr:phosphatase PAP2 family protein [Gemmatimonadaceae bacterium]
MNVARPPVSAATRRTDAVARAIGVALAIYLAIVTFPIWRYATASGTHVALATHLAMLGYTLAVLGARRGRTRPVLDWLTLTVGPLMYVEMRWIIAGLGLPHRDGLVSAWEHALFPSNPSATLALAWRSVPLSEALHLAYGAYYLIVYLPPIILYARGRRDDFVATALALTVVYGACFITYALFPVDGPRYLVGPAPAPDGPMRRFVLTLLEQGSSRGTAFPSSHVAASVVAALCALRYQRRLGLAVAVTASALTVATVYGGFHYAVDALVGVSLGGLSWLASTALWRAASRGVHTATAP